MLLYNCYVLNRNKPKMLRCKLKICIQNSLCFHGFCLLSVSCSLKWTALGRTWSWVFSRSMGAVAVLDTASARPDASTNVLQAPKPDISLGNSMGIARLSPTSNTYRRSNRANQLIIFWIVYFLFFYCVSNKLPDCVSTRTRALQCCPQGLGRCGAETHSSPRSWSCPCPSWCETDTTWTSEHHSLYMLPVMNELNRNVFTEQK